MKNLIAHRQIPHLIELAEELCHRERSPAFVLSFLECYLTPSELASLAIRWQIIDRVAKGDTHREIASDLRVSTNTVSRWALEDWRHRWGE
jgi:uncharacterized protein YerC